MPQSLRHHEPLARAEVHRAVLEVDQETAADHEEEFVVAFVVVPMVFALQHAHPHDRFVHRAQGLVVPGMRIGGDERRDVDHFARRISDVQVGVVRKSGSVFAHGGALASHRCTLRHCIASAHVSR
jgi:hypothetical protein